jgi:integrase
LIACQQCLKQILCHALIFYKAMRLACLVPRSKLPNAHLEAAKITKVDAQGRVVDFHSLRHTFCTNLQRAGVSQREAMELMRHNVRD